MRRANQNGALPGAAAPSAADARRDASARLPASSGHRQPASASDRVLYQEVDIADDGALAHRLLFWPSDEVTIDFRELEYACTPRDDSRVTLGEAFVVEEDGEERG